MAASGVDLDQWSENRNSSIRHASEAESSIIARPNRSGISAHQYWDELTPEQQERYVVEVMDEAGGLLLTLPFREAEQAKADPPKTASITGRKKAHQDRTTDEAD
jgi:hypothetical protein